MASAKPAALTTNFYRSIRSCRPQTYRSLRRSPRFTSTSTSTSTSEAESLRQRRHFTTCQSARQEQGYQRYGPAATPSEPFLPSTEQTKQDAIALEHRNAEHKQQETQKAQRDGQDGSQTRTNDSKEDEKVPPDQKEASEPHPEELVESQKKHSTSEPEHSPSEDQSTGQPSTSGSDLISGLEDDGPLPNRELDMVLSIPSPNEVKSDAGSQSTHPHLEASPYEHHFDTYSLVIELCKATTPPATGADPDAEPVVPFSEAQSVTLMKAIRLMLAQNLDLAKDGLVSKSDTENETYLFRAACSELKTTMQTSRFMEAQKQRSQRAQLQHEFDILNQKVSQDIMTMREELKGMFNDRKLGLQEEKRQVDGKIQGLSYRISVDLNSEAKSEVEGLRWVLTRRAALAIAAAASMTLAFLQYYSVKSRESAEIEKKKQAERQKQEERLQREQERYGVVGRNLSSSTGTQTDAIVLSGTGGSTYEEGLG